MGDAERKRTHLGIHPGGGHEELGGNSEAEFRRLESCLNRVKLVMIVFGLFCRKSEKSVCDRGRFQRYCNSSVLYHVVILVLRWTNFLRFIVSFWLGGVDSTLTVLRLVAMIGTLHVCLSATLFFKASHPHFGHQNKVCELLRANVIAKMSALQIELNTTSLRRHISTGLVLALTGISINVILTSVFFFSPVGPEMSEVFPTLFLAPIPVNTYTKIAVVVCQLFDWAAWILPILYIVVLSSLLNNAFNLSYAALETTVKRQSNQSPENLQAFRMLHLSICEAVELVDSDMKCMYANWYATNIPIACLLVYYAIKTPLEGFVLFLHIFWFVISALTIFVVSCYAARLHDTASSSLDCLYNLTLSGATAEDIAQVELFLSQLTCRSTGFTVMNLIVITKELLLTVCGLYLTFFFVLMGM